MSSLLFFDSDTPSACSGVVHLTIGIPGESIKSLKNIKSKKRIRFTGAVDILNSSDSGLTIKNSQIWFQNKRGVEGTSERTDGFGSS
jgi:hypothetical protein